MIASGAGRKVCCPLLSSQEAIHLFVKGSEFVGKLHHFTSFGYLAGGEEGDRCGLFRLGSGPSMMISTEAVLRFDKKTHEVYLESLLPGVALARVKSKVPWNLKMANPLK